MAATVAETQPATPALSAGMASSHQLHQAGNAPKPLQLTRTFKLADFTRVRTLGTGSFHLVHP